MGRPGDTQDDCGSFAQELAESGYQAFTHERRAFGDVWQDVIGAADYLRANGAETVIAAGASIGAMASLYAAEQPHSGLNGVVCAPIDLLIIPSTRHGTDILTEDGSNATRLVDAMLNFVGEVAGNPDVPADRSCAKEGPDMQSQGPNQRSAMADGSWMAWTTAGIAVIWGAVTLISIFAPDLVSGSEQEHMPVAAFGTWIWGIVATGAFLWIMGRLRGSATRKPVWIGLSLTTVAIWLVAAILSITLPVMETGSDPTRLPIGAIVAPVAAAMLTILAGIVASVFARPPTAG